MAVHLASIYGTEKDRVNCPFYFKVRVSATPPPAFPSRSRPALPRPRVSAPPSLTIADPTAFPPSPSQIGACRHGDRCSRLHMRPTLSQTILMPNMYLNPAYATGGNPNMTPRELEEHFEDFYEDVFDELAKHGEIEGLNVCDNLADHLVGNVYVKFREEEAALSALNAMNGRYYQGRPIRCEFSPVTDFRESTCRQYEERCCNRAGYCNFMHLRPVDRLLRRQLFGQFKRRRRDDDRDRRGRDDRGRDRDRSPRGRKRSRSRSRSRSRGGRDDRDGGEGRVTAKGMSDEERRAMFARWNAGGEAGDADAGAPQPEKEDGETR